jgi:hypothetical protein
VRTIIEDKLKGLRKRSYKVLVELVERFCVIASMGRMAKYQVEIETRWDRKTPGARAMA